MKRPVITLALGLLLAAAPTFATKIKRRTMEIRLIDPPIVSIEGLDHSTVRAQVAYGDVEWGDPVQRQTTSICVPEGSDNVLKDAVEIPTHYLEVPYRVTGGVMVVRDVNGRTLHSSRIDALESTARYGYDSCAYWLPGSLPTDYRRDQAAFRRGVEQTVEDSFLQRARAEIDAALFFEVRKEKVPLFTFKDKKRDYTDLNRATELARAAYAELKYAGSELSAEARAGLDEARSVWRAALDAADLTDRKARIHRKVAAKVHLSLGVADLLTGEPGAAVLHIQRAETARGMSISRTDGTGNTDLLRRAHERAARTRRNATFVDDPARVEALLARSEPHRGRIPIEVASAIDVERLAAEHVANRIEAVVEAVEAVEEEREEAVAGGDANPYEHLVTRTATQGFLLFLSPYQIRSAGFPEEVCRLDHLNQLRLRNHGFATLCDDLGNLDALKVLDLKGNGIERLPESIGGLQGLRKLELSNNAIRTLPRSIGELKELRVLTLKGNPLDAGEVERLERLLPRCKIKT